MLFVWAMCVVLHVNLDRACRFVTVVGQVVQSLELYSLVKECDERRRVATQIKKAFVMKRK